MKNTLSGVAFVTAATVTATALNAQPLPKQQFPYKSGPVTITSCTVNENKSNSTVSGSSLRINYFPNEKGRTLQSITFRVRYAGTPVTVTDTGSFVYQAPISHQFDQLGGHAWAGPSPSVCRVVTATFADGQVVNPPYAGPDGMNPGGPMMPAGQAPMPGSPDGSGAPPPPPNAPDMSPAPNAGPEATPAPPAPTGT